MSENADDWTSFWDRPHSIYVNARHFDVHYRDIAQRIVAQLPGPTARVIDYGCGSGILAIAALRLGAKEALAFDIDPQALLATQQNAERNGVVERLTIAAEAPEALASCDVLVANILAGPLIELGDRFAALLRPGGRIAVSGVLEDQVESVAATYARWFIMRATTVRDGWAMLSGSRGHIS